MIQARNKLGGVASIGPHNGAVVAHGSRRQREDRMTWFKRGDGGDVPGAQARLRRGLQVGLALWPRAAGRAGVAGVGAGPYVAGVGQLSPVHRCLSCVWVLFHSAAVTVRAGWL